MSDARWAGIAVVSRMTYGQRQPTFQIFADVDKVENPDICERIGKGQIVQMQIRTTGTWYYGTQEQCLVRQCIKRTQCSDATTHWLPSHEWENSQSLACDQ
jgi:hypothetical protein